MVVRSSPLILIKFRVDDSFESLIHGLRIIEHPELGRCIFKFPNNDGEDSPPLRGVWQHVPDHVSFLHGGPEENSQEKEDRAELGVLSYPPQVNNLISHSTFPGGK